MERDTELGVAPGVDIPSANFAAFVFIALLALMVGGVVNAAFGQSTSYCRDFDRVYADLIEDNRHLQLPGQTFPDSVYFGQRINIPSQVAGCVGRADAFSYRVATMMPEGIWGLAETVVDRQFDERPELTGLPPADTTTTADTEPGVTASGFLSNFPWVEVLIVLLVLALMGLAYWAGREEGTFSDTSRRGALNTIVNRLEETERQLRQLRHTPQAADMDAVTSILQSVIRDVALVATPHPQIPRNMHIRLRGLQLDELDIEPADRIPSPNNRAGDRQEAQT